MLTALIILSLGGFLLHLRIHPISKNSANIIPVISGLLSMMVIPLLFSFKKTIAYGYVLNGFLVIIGTIAMTHFSLVHPPKPLNPAAILFNTTLADIVILWGKFFIGKSIFELEFFGYDDGKTKKGQIFRYPNMGWWLIHLAGVSLVYFLGNLFWR
jgi:hypothetical protein